MSGTRHIIASEGPRGLLTGFGPTAVGYLAQGGAKFAGYEYWKKTFVEVAGSQEAAVKNRTLIYLGSATVAECVKPIRPSRVLTNNDFYFIFFQVLRRYFINSSRSYTDTARL